MKVWILCSTATEARRVLLTEAERRSLRVPGLPSLQSQSPQSLIPAAAPCLGLSADSHSGHSGISADAAAVGVLCMLRDVLSLIQPRQEKARHLLSLSDSGKYTTKHPQGTFQSANISQTCSRHRHRQKLITNEVSKQQDL